LLFYNCLIAVTYEWNYIYKENYGVKASAVAYDYFHYYNKVTMKSITMLGCSLMAELKGKVLF